MRTNADVCVIGSGMAGLSAAEAMQKHGASVLVLEATSRPGGRIRTVHGNEEGAKYIHNSGLLPVVSKYGLTATAYNEEEGTYLFQEGKGLTKEKASESILDVMQQLRQCIATIPRVHTSIQQFLDDDLYHLHPGLAKKMSRLQAVIETSIQAELGADPAMINVQSLREESTFDRTNFVIQEGFSELPKRMAMELDLQYRTPVERIDWSGSDVTLHTKNGVVLCKQAIITVPIGILQRGTIGFRPTLPSKITEAIHGIGNATICEVIVQLRKAMWNADLRVLRTDLPFAPIVWPNDTHPPSLTSYVGGSPAQQLQKMDTEEAIHTVIDSLALIFGQEIRNFIEGGKRVAWNKKKWKRTAYSFRTAHHAARETLSEPIGKNLILAGEAYINDPSASTVYGAYKSGLHATEQLRTA